MLGDFDNGPGSYLTVATPLRPKSSAPPNANPEPKTRVDLCGTFVSGAGRRKLASLGGTQAASLKQAPAFQVHTDLCLFMCRSSLVAYSRCTRWSAVCSPARAASWRSRTAATSCWAPRRPGSRCADLKHLNSLATPCCCALHRISQQVAVAERAVRRPRSVPQMRARCQPLTPLLEAIVDGANALLGRCTG